MDSNRPAPPRAVAKNQRLLSRRSFCSSVSTLDCWTDGCSLSCSAFPLSVDFDSCFGIPWQVYLGRFISLASFAGLSFSPTTLAVLYDCTADPNARIVTIPGHVSILSEETNEGAYTRRAG